MTRGTVARAEADPLTPLREALLDRARADAARWLAEADAAAASTLQEAERAATALRDQARQRGEDDATAVLAGERARARRQARAVVLGAQREAYETLRQRVRHEIASWEGEPGQPALRERLEDRARHALGPQARVRDAGGGGVVAEAAGRRVEYTVDVLADRAVDGLGAELEGLWTP